MVGRLERGVGHLVSEVDREPPRDALPSEKATPGAAVDSFGRPESFAQEEFGRA